MKVRPVFTGIQDAIRSFEMALLADTIAGRARQSDWIDNVRLTRVLGVSFTRPMATLARYGLEGFCGQKFPVCVGKAGASGVTEYAFFRNRAVEFQDILRCIARRKVPTKTVKPGEGGLE